MRLTIEIDIHDATQCPCCSRCVLAARPICASSRQQRLRPRNRLFACEIDPVLPLYHLVRLQQNPLVSKVSCYDIRGAPGVAADLSHINTPSTAVGYGAENDGLRKALEGADSECRQAEADPVGSV